MPAYFFPPTEAAVPTWDRIAELGLPLSARFRNLLWTRRGKDIDNNGGVTVAGKHYAAGTWNGPLSGQEIIDLGTAGYDDRVFVVTDINELPVMVDG